VSKVVFFIYPFRVGPSQVFFEFHPLNEVKMAAGGALLADWKQHYQTALLEADPAKLSRRIADAHAAIKSRIKELALSSEEYSAMLSALRFLRILENEVSEQREAV